MAVSLLISVHLLDERYHGSGKGPPAPARLFQALVAGAGLGGPLEAADTEALRWLETLSPPVIGMPFVRNGQHLKLYVPNNDMDSIHGDVKKIGKIRTEKLVRPVILDRPLPYLYAWTFEAAGRNEAFAMRICDLSHRLYQFGRGVDMAFADGEVLPVERLQTRLADYEGMLFYPGGGKGNVCLCPRSGTLESLMVRHKAMGRRFRKAKAGQSFRLAFAQPPRPIFMKIGYNNPPERRLFELVARSGPSRLWSFRTERIRDLVMQLRDEAARRLKKALPHQSDTVERVLVGRKANGAHAGPIRQRIHIIPLPSIGHPHADRRIRRVLVEVPVTCPLPPEDVFWAFSGIEVTDIDGGVCADLTPAGGERFVTHFGVNTGASPLWRTVTPAALPRRKTASENWIHHRKNAAERDRNTRNAAAAVLQALRHIEVHGKVVAVEVRKEPFHAHEEHVRAFVVDKRFTEARLWHVEIRFASPIQGPLIIGDGRFMGLGLMAPVKNYGDDKDN